jgi:hypothetical protein
VKKKERPVEGPWSAMKAINDGTEIRIEWGIGRQQHGWKYTRNPLRAEKVRHRKELAMIRQHEKDERRRARIRKAGIQ